MKENTIRIVGGTARGRKLTVPEGMDTRPTMDRVRESVFSWIACTSAARSVWHSEQVLLMSASLSSVPFMAHVP